MKWRVVSSVLAVGLLLLRAAGGCPFCSPVSTTFSENLADMDAVVIARLEKLPDPDKAPGGSAASVVAEATFSILEVLKGREVLGDQRVIKAAPFGNFRPGDTFLLAAINVPIRTWSTPLLLNDRQRRYVGTIMGLPKDSTQRLVFFQEHLEDPDTMLAGDAFDEFARAAYADLKVIGPRMNRDRLVQWIQSPNVSVDHRRLYLTMLGVCGDRRDIPMLQQLLEDKDRRATSGLDALIASYLTLRGPDGLPTIEQMFLKGARAREPESFADVVATVAALRFHGGENDIISRQRIIQSFHLLLDSPNLAELVIPDLARWKDWSPLERLVSLFKAAVAEDATRLSIVNYARACPRPEAAQVLQQLADIDSEIVARSKLLFPRISPVDE